MVKHKSAFVGLSDQAYKLHRDAHSKSPSSAAQMIANTVVTYVGCNSVVNIYVYNLNWLECGTIGLFEALFSHAEPQNLEMWRWKIWKV